MTRRLLLALISLWFAAAAPFSSARAANVLHTYNTAGVFVDPVPGTYTGPFYDFTGEQTFSDADGWVFEVTSPYPNEINFQVNRPDLSQQGYTGQYGIFNHPPSGVVGVATPPLTVGDFTSDRTFPVVYFDSVSEDYTALQILELTFDPTSGAVTSLAADFVQSNPNFAAHLLLGQLRYNSDVSLGAGHPYVLFDQAAYAASETDDGVTITVRREGGTDSAISANYSVTGGTATAGVDYTPISGTLTWAAGDAAPQTIYLPFVKNQLIEGTRTIALSLTSDSVVPVPLTTVTLAQDPLPPSLLHFLEYGFGAQDTTQTSAEGFTFENSMEVGSTEATYFSVESTPGDGLLQEETLMFFRAGQLAVGNYTADKETGFEFNGPFALETIGSEDWQVLMVNYGPDGTLLQCAVNFEVLDTAGKPLVRGELRYHSTLPLRSTVELSSTEFAGDKSAAQVQLTAIRQGDTSEKISVNYATTNYSAVDGTDYTATQGKLMWAAGEGGPKTFTVPLLHDPAGGDRVFFVDLSGKSVGNNAEAVVTIVDDSQPPAASLPEPIGAVDITYPALVSNSAEVYIGVIRPLANGGALVGGNFAAVGGHPQPGIVRLDAAGEPDSSFVSPLTLGVEPQVNAVAVQPDGKALVAGRFTVGTATTQTANLVRLNPDGSLDTSFRESTSVGDGIISALALQADGRILIVGSFGPGSGLARLNADGSLDATFAVPTLSYLDSHSVILWQPDGKVLAIDSYGALKRYDADGSVDDAYVAYGGPFSGSSNATLLQPDGKLVIEVGVDGGGLVRLNRDGTVDTDFSQAFGNSSLGFNVSSLALQPDGKLLVGGDRLSNVSGQPAALARLNPDGSLDGTFTASTTLPPSIGAMALETDGGLLLSAGYLSTEGANVVHTVFAKLISSSQGPLVTLTASVPEAGGAKEQTGEFLLSIPAALSADLTVAYQVKGTGINGTDYAYLKGTVKIKAGETSKVIKVVPQGNLGGSAQKTVKLVLAPGTGYAVSTTSKARVTIVNPGQ